MGENKSTAEVNTAEVNKNW